MRFIQGLLFVFVCAGCTPAEKAQWSEIAKIAAKDIAAKCAQFFPTDPAQIEQKAEAALTKLVEGGLTEAGLVASAAQLGITYGVEGITCVVEGLVQAAETMVPVVAVASNGGANKVLVLKADPSKPAPLKIIQLHYLKDHPEAFKKVTTGTPVTAPPATPVVKK